MDQQNMNEGLNAYAPINLQVDDAWMSNTSLGGRIKYAFENQIGMDVTFEVGENKTRIDCQKLVLIVSSKYFETLFENRWLPIDKSVREPISLPQVSVEEFKLLLKHIYLDRISVFETVSDLLKLLRLAVYFLVPLVEERCCRMLKNNLSLYNCVEIYETSRGNGVANLQKAAFECMINYGAHFFKSERFLELDIETISLLLKSDDVHVEEAIVLEALLRWIKAHCSDSETEAEYIRRLIYVVRFPLFPYMLLEREVLPQLPTGLIEENVLSFLKQGKFSELPNEFNCKPRSSRQWFNPYKEVSIFERGVFMENANRVCKLRVCVDESILFLGVRSTVLSSVDAEDTDVKLDLEVSLEINIPSSIFNTSLRSQLGKGDESFKILFNCPVLVPPKTSFNVSLKIRPSSENTIYKGANSLCCIHLNPVGFNFELVEGQFPNHGVIDSLIYI